MFMGTARVCHKCREYVETGETFETQRVIRAFEQDHKGHPVGNADLDEVESYLNVTDTYYARLAGESEEDANASDGGDLYESPDDLVTEVDVGEPENEEVGQSDLGKYRRTCPQCGSHDINEVEDRTRVVSFIPKTMYAKKFVCRRCSTEFG